MSGRCQSHQRLDRRCQGLRRLNRQWQECRSRLFRQNFGLIILQQRRRQRRRPMADRASRLCRVHHLRRACARRLRLCQRNSWGKKIAHVECVAVRGGCHRCHPLRKGCQRGAEVSGLPTLVLGPQGTRLPPSNVQSLLLCRRQGQVRGLQSLVSGPQGTWLPPTRTLLPPSRRPEVELLDLQALVLGPQGTRFPPSRDSQPLLPLSTLTQVHGGAQMKRWREHLAISLPQ